MQPEESKWLVLSKPLQPPAINSELGRLSVIPRSTECLRYFALSIEYWLSPNGRLRHWLKINLFLGACLFIPAVFLMPVISLVLHEVDGWFTILVNIVLKLIVLSILVTVAMLAIKHFPSSLRDSSRKRK